MAGTLFVVGTPIGNLGDASPRARETLAGVDLIAAEDTRRTGRLLQGFGVKAKLVSLFDGNERERTPELLARLRQGSSIAIVSDGGMPLVSDPGYRLVAAAVGEGIDVRVVPGPSALVAALVVSGLPMERFAFEGFLPRKAGERTRRLETLRRDPRTVVIYESPQRVATLLRDVLATLGDRRVAVCRELTKLHEEVLRGRVSDVLGELGGAAPKGEVVVVLEGDHDDVAGELTAAIPEARALVDSGMRAREAARTVAARRRVAANDLYRALVTDR
ncbi:MAG TPA: 16S rRNA (cytidine(1402)-2'-O)-methyltransferase [Actinomycetota bacterium]|nr:16S rRNA (cytidine(1402)-2'-O)-methyltransferase [Actinomycetota bacterium]